MNYAAAVGDDNPRCFDDERPAGVVAPPMLAVALTWPLAAGMPALVPAHRMLMTARFEIGALFAPLGPRRNDREGRPSAPAVHRGPQAGRSASIIGG